MVGALDFTSLFKTVRSRDYLAQPEHERQSRAGFAGLGNEHDSKLSNLKTQHFDWIKVAYRCIVDHLDVVLNSMRETMPSF